MVRTFTSEAVADVVVLHAARALEAAVCVLARGIPAAGRVHALVKV